mmetsp:Transcript_25675/g.39492  ORF Transcript_25675/g.39492 Transcript_25675/m.39492 type:complete len:111 (+) Transcript_25675:563-895(+)|eukprot:CAMPEP_0170501410 /NCGR_PEP_ID=MMETSP0208-20121228/38204_1 /TAXON_ID=197538 /ORGANISM="Strombidium inclinatum, Strain S3" /LENGTH=110 /DNA_ID=CAMNT_0010779945 /DNA_START=487 /DNA_END=819 /DNA_ORIENTATION=+
MTIVGLVKYKTTQDKAKKVRAFFGTIFKFHFHFVMGTVYEAYYAKNCSSELIFYDFVDEDADDDNFQEVKDERMRRELFINNHRCWYRDAYGHIQEKDCAICMGGFSDKG